MKRSSTMVLTMILVLALLGACESRKDEPSVEETTLTEVGQTAPDFRVATLAGDTFSLSDHRGQVVLINWFATWCPPCIQEMPHLQQEVWERFQGPDFVMVSIARAETLQVVRPFVDKHGLTWPFALDPRREAYARYASAYIPRNQVVDRTGTIIFQSQGFEKDEFAEMIEVIRKEIGVE